MRISLFMPCFNDAFFAKTGFATVRLLERLGHEVSFPMDQTCCGQIHFNTGYRKEARRLLQRFVGVFGDAEVVVAPSASCVAMVREHYDELLAGPAESQKKAGQDSEDRKGGPREGGGTLRCDVRDLAGRVFELSEFLVRELGVEDVGARFPWKVSLHPTCHSIRGIDVGDAPLRLLRAVRDLELVELPNPRECCGFGGTFSVKNPHTSLAMLDDKIRDVRGSGADVLTSVDNSCLLHIAGGLHRHGLLEVQAEGPPPDNDPTQTLRNNRPSHRIRVMHLVEILACRDGAAS